MVKITNGGVWICYLIVASLKKGRVNGAKWLEAFGGEASSKGNGMLLGDSDVKATIGKSFLEIVETSATSHGGMNCYDLLVSLCFCYQ